MLGDKQLLVQLHDVGVCLDHVAVEGGDGGRGVEREQGGHQTGRVFSVEQGSAERPDHQVHSGNIVPEHR